MLDQAENLEFQIALNELTEYLDAQPKEIKVPSSFAPFIIFDDHAIRLGLWPEGIYAGRLSVLGERIGLRLLPDCGVRV